MPLKHIPVMISEVLHYLDCKPGKIYVEGRGMLGRFAVKFLQVAFLSALIRISMQSKMQKMF